MGRRNEKVPKHIKLEYAKRIVTGELSAKTLARQQGLNETQVRYWVALYKAQGESAFVDTGENKVYSAELRLAAVQDYLHGEGSYLTVAAKYGLSKENILATWVKMYNDGKDFSRKMSGGSRMKTSRSTTKDERVQIVKECLANDCNYGETAIKHCVSYQQVYGWVRRYKELGEAGLEDRRGKRKADQQPRSEEEKLRIENEQLKHKLYMAEMERDLLKKVKELEREELLRK